MKTLLRKIFSFFSSYTDSDEKKIGQFFRTLSKNQLDYKKRKKLEYFLQNYPEKFFLLLEKKYKGYKILRKKQRKTAYENFQTILADFSRFQSKNSEKILKKFQKISIPEMEEEKKEKVFFLFCISQYISQKMEYKKSSAFIFLLKNPKEEMLQGDCNQLVTLYAALYTQEFPISDLQVKIFQSHVCLHFEGVDIETTNGKFCLYEKFLFISPFLENISISLLDISDPELLQEKISPHALLEASRIAFLFSSHRQIVEKNMRRAEKNMALFLLSKKNFSSSIFWAKKSGEKELEEKIYFQWGKWHLEKKNFDTARKKFQKISHKKALKACDANELNFLIQKAKKQKKPSSFVLEKIKKLSKKLR